MYVISSAGGQKNSTVTANKTISLSLSEESVETLKDFADTSSQVSYYLLISLLGFGFWFRTTII